MTLRKRFIVGLISLHLMMSCTHGNETCKASISGRRGACPPTWKLEDGRCYKAITELLTWHKAKDECLKMDSVLAAPRSQEETEILKSLAQELYHHFWINCNDLDEEGTWKCEGGNGEVAFRNWGDGNPNNDAGQEHCALVSRYTGKWDDDLCRLPLPAICTRPEPQLHF